MNHWSPTTFVLMYVVWAAFGAVYGVAWLIVRWREKRQ